MDLIYMNSRKEDIGVLQDFIFDLAYGYDENNFELTTSTNNHVCFAGNIIYIENTEYGGIIRKIRVNTKANELIYIGDTWHGIIARKILQPDVGQDYIVCNGEANAVIGNLIARLSLGDLFKTSAEISEIMLNNYQMNRYINGYEGIKKMLASANAKLNITFKEGFVFLSAEPFVDYSVDDEFDSSQIDFDVEKNYKPVNHVICLGKGELKNREIIHIFANESGNISSVQSQFGLDEIVDVYENANCESSDELRQGGINLLLESWNTDSLQVELDSTKIYDIGDIVGAREITTGIVVSKPIIKKIVTIKDSIIKITHKVGE